LTGVRDSEWAKELREQHQAEEREIGHWLAGQVDVTAERSTSYAPEQWEGSVDRHSIYFRERHGEWRIELDLQPSGRFAKRFVEVEEGGQFVTEPVELPEGEVIAEGVEGALGSTAVEHLDFIVPTIREHPWQRSCSHGDALLYFPGAARGCDVNESSGANRGHRGRLGSAREGPDRSVKDDALVEVGNDPQLAAQRLGVGLERSQLGASQRAVLDLADSRLNDVHRVSEGSLVQRLSHADFSQPLGLDRVGELVRSWPPRWCTTAQWRPPRWCGTASVPSGPST
jgi:hypothetical protein